MPRPNARTEKRTYGRRKGHTLSARKQSLMDTLLPALTIDIQTPAPSNTGEIFDPPKACIGLEIGFGAGEHLVWQADRHPDWGFIGCEVFHNGVAALLGRVDEAGIENILLYDEDARDLLPWLPDASIDRIFILFPDPWPKKRHHKRRLVSGPTLDQIARILKPGAELRIASDIPDYIRTTLIAVRRSGLLEWRANCASDWRVRPDDWPETRYEQKAHRGGRSATYLTFVRK